MKFKTPKSQKGMTERQYLKSVFYRNREAITNVFGKGKGAMNRFIKNIEAQKVIGGGLTTKQALKKLGDSEAFTQRGERLKENIQKALKNFGKAKEFKGLIRDEKGHFQAFDEDKLVWDKDAHIYVYDHKITIDVTNSPEDIIIGVI